MCDSPLTIELTAEKAAKHGVNHVPVPCGRCYLCRKRRVAQWSFRLLKELEVSISAYFVTLTYDNNHVPITKGRFPLTLLKNSIQDNDLKKLEYTDDAERNKQIEQRSDRSLQAFFKRLRYYEEQKTIQFDSRTKKLDKKKPIKYYACGEYGSTRKRPHYHIIIFNVTSISNLRKAWSTAIVENGKTVGYIPFGEIDIDDDVNINNIDYCLKYLCKEGTKVGAQNNDHRIPEFAIMSKGLGANFITPRIETFYNSRLDISYVVNQRGHKVPMPKYYIDKMMTEVTKDDRITHVKIAVEERERLDKKPPRQKMAEKMVRQTKMKDYAKRRVD